MHELSVTENILEIALRHAEQAPGQNITGIYLVIGSLSSIIDDSIQFYWDMVAAGTRAEGARLHFRRIPAELICLECSCRYSPDGTHLACPSCASTHVRVTAGDEFFMEAIEVGEENAREARTHTGS